jgi:hypothetical protein
MHKENTQGGLVGQTVDADTRQWRACVLSEDYD